MGSSQGAGTGALPHAPSTPPASSASLDAVWAGAQRRMLAGLIALPAGVGLAVLAAWASTRPVAIRWEPIAVGGAALEVALVVPRVLRVWRLWRARRHDRRVRGVAQPVRVAVQPSAALSALPAVVAVWPAGAPDDPPLRVDAVDRSARPLVDGGRMWATVVGGPHRLATYRLEDGTPIIAAGRTNVRQRWLSRARSRTRRAGGLDRRPDAPYPDVHVDGGLLTELWAVAVPMVALALCVAGFGMLAIAPPLSSGVG